jgi:hypothetical protein
LPVSVSLFLDSQKRLERMTERLRFLSEDALTQEDRKRVVDMVSFHILHKCWIILLHRYAHFIFSCVLLD